MTLPAALDMHCCCHRNLNRSTLCLAAKTMLPERFFNRQQYKSMSRPANNLLAQADSVLHLADIALGMPHQQPTGQEQAVPRRCTMPLWRRSGWSQRPLSRPDDILLPLAVCIVHEIRLETPQVVANSAAAGSAILWESGAPALWT